MITFSLPNSRYWIAAILKISVFLYSKLNFLVSYAEPPFWLLLIKIPIVYSFSLSKPNKNQNMMHFDGFMLRQNAKIAVFNILIDEYQR